MGNIFGKSVIDQIHARINLLIAIHNDDTKKIKKTIADLEAKHDEDIDDMTNEMNRLKKSVSDGKDAVANTITGHFGSPVTVTKSIYEYDKYYPSFADLSNAITGIGVYNTKDYNLDGTGAGHRYSFERQYAYMKTVNIDASVEYNNGYTAGVEAAAPQGTAERWTVLRNYTFQSAAVGKAAAAGADPAGATLPTGSMPDNGNWGCTVEYKGKANTDHRYDVAVPVGYHGGHGSVSCATAIANAYDKGSESGYASAVNGLPSEVKLECTAHLNNIDMASIIYKPTGNFIDIYDHIEIKPHEHLLVYFYNQDSEGNWVSVSGKVHTINEKGEEIIKDIPAKTWTHGGTIYWRETSATQIRLLADQNNVTTTVWYKK